MSVSSWTSRPLVLGHRGARAYAPENTLVAFDLALQQGADGVELDVYLSKDGQVVIIHDAELERTTDGHGRVQDKTLAELQALDASHRFATQYPSARIPTLDEVLLALGNRCRCINVEIKSDSPETDGLEQAVAACITRHGLSDNILVSSFNPLALERFHQALPHIAIGFLTAAAAPELEQIAASLSLQARHPHFTQVDAAYMHWARERHWRVNTWTVNDPEQAVSLAALGVDALITDVPDVILSALHERH